MAQNLQLDPVKKDYVVVNGSPIPSDRVEEASYIALTIPQGQWLYGQTSQGSQIYTLQNQKRNATIEQLFATYSEDAIERNVIVPGKGTAVQAQNIATSRTGTSNQIEVIPAASQLSNQLNFTSV
jgi:phage gp46-like protein